MVIVFTIGVFVGCIITRLLFNMTSGHGEFIITPYDEDNTGFYTVNVRVDTKCQINCYNVRFITTFQILRGTIQWYPFLLYYNKQK